MGVDVVCVHYTHTHTQTHKHICTLNVAGCWWPVSQTPIQLCLLLVADAFGKIWVFASHRGKIDRIIEEMELSGISLLQLKIIGLKLNPSLIHAVRIRIVLLAFIYLGTGILFYTYKLSSTLKRCNICHRSSCIQMHANILAVQASNVHVA